MRTIHKSIVLLLEVGMITVAASGLTGCSDTSEPTSDRQPNITPIVVDSDRNQSETDGCSFVSAYYEEEIPDSSVIEVTDDGYIRGNDGIYNFDTRIMTDMDNVGELSVAQVNCGDTVLRNGLYTGWVGSRYYFQAFNVGGDINEYQERYYPGGTMSYPGEPDYELTRETYESFDMVSFTSMDIFAKLTSRVSSNSFDYADVIPSYHFSVEGIDRAYLEGLEQGVSYQSDSMDVYILRQEKDGIPITFYNSMYASRFIAWDNRCMGFTLVGEWTDNADLVNGMYVPADVDPYNIENVYEDGITPVRIEDCIVNCIPEIAYDTSDMGALQSVVIYSAELTYLKADAFNADTMASYMWNDEYNSQVYWLIPVWKITYFAEDADGMTRIGAVMLNAKTGTGMEVDNEYLECVL